MNHLQVSCTGVEIHHLPIQDPWSCQIFFRRIGKAYLLLQGSLCQGIWGLRQGCLYHTSDLFCHILCITNCIIQHLQRPPWWSGSLREQHHHRFLCVCCRGLSLFLNCCMNQGYSDNQRIQTWLSMASSIQLAILVEDQRTACTPQVSAAWTSSNTDPLICYFRQASPLFSYRCSCIPE